MADLDKRLQRIVEKVGSIVTRHDRLNSAEWLLRTDFKKIQRILGNYKRQLRISISDFVQSKYFEKMSKQAIDDFISSLKGELSKADIKTINSRRSALLTLTQRELIKQYRSITDDMINRQLSKARALRVRSTLAQITAGQKASAQNISRIRIGKVDYDARGIDNIFDRLQERYGKNGQIIFNSGKKMPLRTYVDGKTQTAATEVHRMTTVLTSAANGIYFGRINRTGTKDSCIIHENEIVFMSSSAKRAFIRENPGLASKVRNFQTVQEIEADSTHMFSFNCKHLVKPVSLQFFNEEKFKDEAESNVVNRVGRTKLSESKIEKAIIDGKIDGSTPVKKIKEVAA